MGTPTYPFILKGAKTAEKQFRVIANRHDYRRGAVENWLNLKMNLLGDNFFRNDVAVVIDGHKYEPDYAYIDQEKGIYIDVEMDEPYTWKGMPCHCIDSTGISADNHRDRLFVSAGWTVVRFSERQLFCQTKACLGVVSRIIGSADDQFRSRYSELIGMESPEKEVRWTSSESRQMRISDYREHYLGFHTGRCNAPEIAKFALHQISSILSGQWKQ